MLHWWIEPLVQPAPSARFPEEFPMPPVPK